MEFSINNLNEEQQIALKSAMDGDNLFITGGGGSGKSYLAKRIIRELSRKGKRVIVTAPTGIAAVPLEGTTLHSLLGLGYGPALTETTGKVIIHASKQLKMADVIIVDEISMVRLDVMDSLLLSIKKAEEKTGTKKQLIVIGDFFQLPPVITDEDRLILEAHYGSDVRYGYAFQAREWKSRHFKTVVLTEIIRQADHTFITALNSLREGKMNSDLQKYFNGCYGRSISDATNLYPFNKQVEYINNTHIDALPGELYEYPTETEGDHLPCEMEELGLPATLRLKTGASVIITMNDNDDNYNVQLMLDGSEEYIQKKHKFVNGTRGIINRCESGFIDVMINPEDYNNREIVRFERQTYTLFDYVITPEGILEKKAVGSYYQFPIKPAYALTTHRGQGQTLDKVIIEPTSKAPGQLYVALSRCRSIQGISLVRPIEVFDLKVADEVKEFYAHLNDEEYTYSWEPESKGKGRPSKRHGKKSCWGYVDLNPLYNKLTETVESLGDTEEIHKQASTLLEEAISKLKALKGYDN